jgi:hypothetical protein
MIADNGYYKNQLYEELRTNHVDFIMPLPRDDKRIDDLLPTLKGGVSEATQHNYIASFVWPEMSCLRM